MKRALIIGCDGQDGQLLYQHLEMMDYQLLGIDRLSVKSTEAGWYGQMDISNTQAVFDVLKSFIPDEIYYLAAFHHSAEDALPDNIELFRQSYQINVFCPINFIEGMLQYARSARLFYAASSHIFGASQDEFQDENTPLNPECIYGITKAAGLSVCRFYRKRYALFASAGILYNHESALRSDKFISLKIIKAALDIKQGKKEKLVLGDLNAEVDWGYAPDYIEAMQKILSLEKADDFVIATGKKHSVLEFVKVAFDCLELDWKKYVFQDSSLITKPKHSLVGNPKKLKAITGWKPSVNFEQMIERIITKVGQL